jgi:murein DD-endopeptidase MepM/ murein hydrolase activator NlpD
MIALDHGYGVSTIFAHLSKVGVKEGQTINRGEVIGNVGSSGATTGPHLHYEVQVDGFPSDPLAFIVK